MVSSMQIEVEEMFFYLQFIEAKLERERDTPKKGRR